MTYEEQLQTPEWAAKRREIIERDLGMCQRCMSSRELQVHHKRYRPGRMAWEYYGTWENFDLITLCRKCHCAEHGIEYVSHESKKLSSQWSGYSPVSIQPVKHIREVIAEAVKNWKHA